MTDTRISYGELATLLTAIFVRHGCSPEVAAILGENMAAAERDGAPTVTVSFASLAISARSTAAGWMAMRRR